MFKPPRGNSGGVKVSDAESSAVVFVVIQAGKAMYQSKRDTGLSVLDGRSGTVEAERQAGRHQAIDCAPA